MSAGDGVRVVSEATKFLELFPHIQWFITNGTLEVTPDDPSGFRVALDDGEAEATLWCHHWHSHFSDADECLLVFKGLFERSARVVATCRGGSEHLWTLEVEVDWKWQSFGTTGLLFFPFWKAKTVIYYENKARLPSRT